MFYSWAKLRMDAQRVALNRAPYPARSVTGFRSLRGLCYLSTHIQVSKVKTTMCSCPLTWPSMQWIHFVTSMRHLHLSENHKKYI